MLSIVAYILLGIGGLGLLAGSLWFLVVTFQKGILWGLGSLLLPFVGLIFLVKFWHDAWKPWVLQILSTLLMGVGFALWTSTIEPAEFVDTSIAMEDAYSDEAYDGDEAYEDADDDTAYDDDPYAEDDTTAADDPYAEDAATATTDAADSDGTPASDTAETTASAPEPTLPDAPLGTVSPPPSRSPSTAPPARFSGNFGRSSDADTIPIEFAADYIGQRLKITKTGGNVVYCRLMDVTDDALVVNQSLGGGHVKFTLPKSTIARLAKDTR